MKSNTKCPITNLLSPSKAKDFIETSKTRELVGMQPVKMGFKLCLKCDKQFFSEDKRNQHMCSNCGSASSSCRLEGNYVY